MNILYILAAIVILGVIVTFHEFGHYLVGRLTGMAILEFSVGFGPKLFGFRRGGIDYSLRLIPLGGYCMFLGEDNKDDDPRAMRNQPVWKRFLTVAAGPLMNFVLALIAAFFVIWGYGTLQSAPLIAAVTENSPAYEAGLQAGDRITAVNGTEVTFDVQGAQDMIDIVGAAGANGVEFVYTRDGSEVTSTITPALDPDGVYRIGVQLGTTELRFTLGESLKESVDYVWYVGKLTVDSLRQLITTGEGIEDTMGPVGIIGFVSEEVRQGFDMVLYLVVLLSLNLGVMNLLPIPGLDGGRLLFLIVEGIRRKPIDPEKEGLVHGIGLLLLLGLILVITYRDIVRLFTGG